MAFTSSSSTPSSSTSFSVKMIIKNWSSVIFLILLCICLMTECDAQSLERGVRAPKAKFIRFGRSGQKFIRFGRNSWDYDPEVEDSLDAEAYYEPTYRFFKRGGQKFIRFG